MIYLTDLAKEELVKTLESKAELSHPVRLYITAFGWGGPRFGLALDEQQEVDKLIEVDGFKFVVEDDLYSQFAPFNVDFAKGWMGKGFVVNSQKHSSRC